MNRLFSIFFLAGTNLDGESRGPVGELTYCPRLCCGICESAREASQDARYTSRRDRIDEESTCKGGIGVGDAEGVGEERELSLYGVFPTACHRQYCLRGSQKAEQIVCRRTSRVPAREKAYEAGDSVHPPVYR